jgi:hydrogenase small subunit
MKNRIEIEGGSKESTQTIANRMKNRGITRREFLGFCGMMAAALALPRGAEKVIAQALASSPRQSVIWLEFQGCTGDSESFLRAAQSANPLDGGVQKKITDLLLDVISVDYHETLMAPSGDNAEKSRTDTIANYPGQYLLVVEGSIPLAANGHYCVIGGKTALGILQETIAHAKGTIALGTCAAFGGLARANPNPTGATGVAGAIRGANVIALPGCPANVINLVATIIHLISFPGTPLAVDSMGRPDFAYNSNPASPGYMRIHSHCERRERDEVEMWGDAKHIAGGCLKEMGCMGPYTYSNCWQVKWNDSTCWPIQAGHGCIGCVQPDFWDAPYTGANPSNTFYASHED